MNGKIGLTEIVFTLVVASLTCWFGFYQGAKRVEKQVEQIDSKVEAEKVTEKMEPKSVELVEKWETVTMNVSAYCSCEKCCEQWAAIPVSSGKRTTASGHIIKIGDRFVAAPRSYPFGTAMIIEGYANGKIVKVEDVGGAIKGNKLDLYFDQHQDALNWGRKNVDVKVKKQ